MVLPSSLLIIDDEPGIRHSLTDIFRQEGVTHIREVGTAEEGLQVLAEEPFSLIICDHRLTGMTGLAFTGKLRTLGDQTPILLITGVPNKESVMQAAAQLRVRFLAKPFTIHQLMSEVEHLMHQ